MKQFVRYALVGALATAVNIAVAGVCSAWVLPCLSAGDPLVVHFGFPSAAIADSLRAIRAVVCNFAGFAVANVVCWLLNRKFVFTPGRHRWHVELALFFGGSAFAVACGSATIWALVKFAGMQTTYSFLVNILVSVVVNFAVRKKLVFKN